MTIIIPDELVPLLRDGLYFDLHGQLEEAVALIEPRGRADIRAAVAGCLGRAKGTRALLDVLGWIEPVDRPSVVEVDVRRLYLLAHLLVKRRYHEHLTLSSPRLSQAPPASYSAPTSSSVAVLSARTFSPGGCSPPLSCCPSRRSRCATWPTWSATVSRPTSRGRSAGTTASRHLSFGPR